MRLASANANERVSGWKESRWLCSTFNAFYCSASRPLLARLLVSQAANRNPSKIKVINSKCTSNSYIWERVCVCVQHTFAEIVGVLALICRQRAGARACVEKSCVDLIHTIYIRLGRMCMCVRDPLLLLLLLLRFSFYCFKIQMCKCARAIIRWHSHNEKQTRRRQMRTIAYGMEWELNEIKIKFSKWYMAPWSKWYTSTICVYQSYRYKAVSKLRASQSTHFSNDSAKYFLYTHLICFVCFNFSFHFVKITHTLAHTHIQRRKPTSGVCVYLIMHITNEFLDLRTNFSRCRALFSSLFMPLQYPQNECKRN